MSDFVNSGWSLFVAVATIVSLVACLALLMFASRRQKMADDNTTGHVWDGDLQELNNPLPRWWMVLFILTVLFSFAYVWLYPGLGSSQGRLNWSSQSQLDNEQVKAQEAMKSIYGRLVSMDAAALSADKQAMGIGERLYLNNCAQCHGSDAKGSKGFPNLTDSDWLWGGGFEQITTTIREGRNGVMPPMAAAVGSAEDQRNVAQYVLSLSGSPHNSVAAELGRPKFAVCAACHGADGRGNVAMGAPNLTDKVWLHGWGEDFIVSLIRNGKNNGMPAQGGRLTPEQVHVLAGYVWSLSNKPGSTKTASAQ